MVYNFHNAMRLFNQKRYVDETASTETLLNEERKVDDEEHLVIPRTKNRITTTVAVPYALLFILTIYAMILRNQITTNPARYAQTLFSPAQDALKPKIEIFEQGFGREATPYQGQPSPELDTRWEALYKFGMTKISLREAALLPNRTLMLPNQHDGRGNKPEYLILLDVFHQLHCLNMIRRRLYPSYYKFNDTGPDGEDDLLGLSHIDHCVDSIRQSLMCHADVTPVIYTWSDTSKRYVAKTHVPHVCRNFDAVSAWASERTLEEKIDMTVRQPNDPLDSSTWT